MNPLRWLQANRERNLADYAASQPSPASVAASALALHGVSKRRAAYEAKRRTVVDGMREAAGLPKWRWQ